ncbi:ADP-ribosyl-[dinitrogen reductase] hydrolase [Dysgonomonas sp. PFB1-18]|uniref:ADP-ribosylglycohydrolase family protein n=1 Tax=unclassified Dysgonomonas TaxID=2630389 RepID=UPI002475AA18|nr:MULTISPECIES: ADP-ribosylglycohydrolase family protein [unclassified Dysgonomonas]MDH6307191.1 ADP-ribosyl-[dinitrogen reductase] hydrolase [Dysgonomonas sp. PF1-14]MDH6337110.1 ADP-ribosyl-[dinitrogen reductase] hydrolase [Dysgonomonas sp. PF1-16]MDH6381096.1 ADP-ribosyl-[dinitrogen reductase] hydrolase [Dysgonomonas sp. PFB1-18]MDH6396325.1 ADP-ribosyl-[dinitrogen reductase] hydrolase [Dysgonomonas sp. PF1-23]
MDIKDRLKGCLIAGAVGDALGHKYEGIDHITDMDIEFDWQISDDTQLTVATSEVLHNAIEIEPEKVAERFLYWYNKGKLSGLGASTLKALRELQVGGHWAIVGRSGEFAAGNGAAMRIAPLAFKKYATRLKIRDICSITHRNDEAYTGALTVYYAIKASILNIWEGDDNLIDYVIEKIPDTRVRDRLIEVNKLKHLSIAEIGEIYKPTGYVVDSVPMAIFAAQKINQSDFKSLITSLIKIGGDTDTVCSMFGQITGALKGIDMIPAVFMNKFDNLEVSQTILDLVDKWRE